MFIIETEIRRDKVELLLNADFNLEKQCGRIWMTSARTPNYLKPYKRLLDNSLKCINVKKNLTQHGAAYVGDLTGEKNNQKPLRFYIY